MKFFVLLCVLNVAVVTVSGHVGIDAGIGAIIGPARAGIGTHAGVAADADIWTDIGAAAGIGTQAVVGVNDNPASTIVGSASTLAGTAIDLAKADVEFKKNIFNMIASGLF